MKITDVTLKFMDKIDIEDLQNLIQLRIAVIQKQIKDYRNIDSNIYSSWLNELYVMQDHNQRLEESKIE